MVEMRTTFGVESWQFFAFVFAALTAVVFALLDELQIAGPFLVRAGLKLLVFAILGYLTLFNLQFKRRLLRVLPLIKRGEITR